TSPQSTLVPYTTLFRALLRHRASGPEDRGGGPARRDPGGAHASARGRRRRGLGTGGRRLSGRPMRRGGAGDIDRAIDGYLDHLTSERGVARNTMESYARDLGGVAGFLAAR